MKKIIGIILTIFIILITNILGLISPFKSNGSVKNDGSFSGNGTSIYKAVEAFQENYNNLLKEKMDAIKQDLIQKNTYQVTEVNPITGELEIKQVCKITVTETIQQFDYAMLVAYLMYNDGVDEDTGAIDSEKAQSFIDKICTISTVQSSEYQYDISNDFEDEDQVANQFFTNESTKNKFLASYAAFESFFGTSDVGSSDNSNGKKDTESNIDVKNQSFLSIPLYLQYKEPWGSVPYGDGTIRNKGCSPTCLGMVMSYLKQQQILPNDIVAFTGNRYYVNGQGSSWGIFNAVASHYGVGCSNLGDSVSSLVAALSAGKPVIASMGPGTFTKSGHFIVLTGITSDGKITVNDPNDSASKNHKGTQFPISLILRESKNFWSFG